VFRRINFFKGLFARAQDWQDGERYHIEKRKLHNTTLHSPGIVRGFDVKAAATGHAIGVGAGVAVADDGQEICLDEPVERPVPWAERKEGQDVLYVVVRTDDENVDFRQDIANTEYSGHAFIEERATVSVGFDAPRTSDVLLAQVKLAPGATRLLDANDKDNPKDNEIDLRGRKRAGAVAVTASILSAGVEVANATTQVGSVPTDPDREYDVFSWSVQANQHAFHVASVYPEAGFTGDVSWRLGASRSAGGVKYVLFVRNHTQQSIRVAYRILRLQ